MTTGAVVLGCAKGLRKLCRCLKLTRGMRKSVGLLRAGLRGLHTSQARLVASSNASSSATFPSWLPSGPNRISTPLTQPLPGVQVVEGLHASDEPPPTEVTTLSNGVRIVSEASMVSTYALSLFSLILFSQLWQPFRQEVLAWLTPAASCSTAAAAQQRELLLSARALHPSQQHAAFTSNLGMEKPPEQHTCTHVMPCVT